ncbi:hypothetical protein [Effusibacillus dendaii]|uniref:hypothetical protein n=1 Tax=Effusibacillus dendaii TaxID=2743772 RepID=UPI0019095A2C|nr:hypothetical protein [Effusibacillus dendaii]
MSDNLHRLADTLKNDLQSVKNHSANQSGSIRQMQNTSGQISTIADQAAASTNELLTN